MIVSPVVERVMETCENACVMRFYCQMDFVLTTDNSAGIGEKEAMLFQLPDEIVSYFAARVALLEQWAAGATSTVDRGS